MCKISFFSCCFRVLWFSGLLFVGSVQAATPNISPAQLAALKAMSPSQQAALAKQYGVDFGQPSSVDDKANSFEQQVSVEPRMPEFLDNETHVEADDTNEKGLQPFGYDLFAGEPTSFEPLNDIPVSSDYILGAGDSLKVQLYGKQSSEFELFVDAQGQVQFPELGPLSLGGLEFSEAKARISETVSRRMIGVKASVSMGELRSIRVFVLGDAYRPGSYVVSSLSTITNALVLSGGVAKTGSLRNIQLKRKGKLIATLDLYELLLKGNNQDDLGLRSGDVVFIPPLGATASIDGEVLRPAIYELKAPESVAELIFYAGGLNTSAYPAASVLERVNQNYERIVKNLDLTSSKGVAIKSGDRLFIPSQLEKLEKVVSLKGHVYRPGVFSWSPGLTLKQVISSPEMLRPGADFRYGLVKRYDRLTGRLSVLTFELDSLFGKSQDTDLSLSEGDEVYVFGLYAGLDKAAVDAGKGTFKDQSAAALGELRLANETGNSGIAVQLSEEDSSKRRVVIDGIIAELRAQAEIGSPTLEVEVTGSVRYPGVYPLTKNMTPTELIYAAGGLTEKAYTLTAEINRSSFDEARVRKQERLDVNINSNNASPFKLQARDVLQVRATPEWTDNTFVTLSGEVRFPGRYPIHRGDTLRTVLERAGGVTAYAYVPGAMFTRKALREQEEERLADMRRRLSEDITKAQLTSQDDNKGLGQDVGTAQQLLAQLNNTPAVGRLVIDLAKVINDNPDYQVVLEDGDELTIPPKRNSVTVIGEVQAPTSQLFQPRMDYNDYIASSGGTTDNADEERIYIIKANGSVVLPETSSWFASNSVSIDPGDTVVVPLDADKIDQVVLWRDMSQIFYQIALGAAAVGSL